MAQTRDRAAAIRSDVIADHDDDALIGTCPGSAVADRDLIAAFRSLDDRQQQVIWWSEVDGLTDAEIGAEFGVSASAAAALGYRARRALRQAYATRLLSAAPSSTDLG